MDQSNSPPVSSHRRSQTPLLLECDRPPPGWRCTRGVHAEGPCAAVPRLCEIVNPGRFAKVAGKCDLVWGHPGMLHSAGEIGWFSPATEPLHHTRQRNRTITPCPVAPRATPHLPSVRAPGGRLFGPELPPPALAPGEREQLLPPCMSVPPMSAEQQKVERRLREMAEAQVRRERRANRSLLALVVVLLVVIAGLVGLLARAG